MAGLMPRRVRLPVSVLVLLATLALPAAPARAQDPVGPGPQPPPPVVVPPPVVAPAPVPPPVTLETRPTAPGRLARLRTNGHAAIPRRAPPAVRAIFAAATRIVGRPYKWGGGHARIADRGYDCSGAVSYA